MLTVEAIAQLAQDHNLEFVAHYPQSTAAGLVPPSPTSLSVRFREECVDAWFALMTQLTQVPVRISGTRQVTGSGATDDRLYPGYRARLAEVNQLRATVGLSPVYG